ncbi:MAG: PulJ/GspJ family protein [Victivallaceae bacterium]
MIKRNNNRPAYAYFTLLEVVVSLMIMAAIMLTIAITLKTVYNSWAKTSKLAAQSDWRRNIDQVVNTAFKNAVYFTWRNDSFVETMVFDGQQSSLLLPYLHRINAGDVGGIRFLQLYQENDKLIARYRDTPAMQWQNASDNDLNKEIIADNVKRVSFLYADIAPEDNSVHLTDNWNNDKNIIPRGIQITIEFENGYKESWFRRTAGSAFMQNKATR